MKADHKDKDFDPAEYTFVEYFYQGPVVELMRLSLKETPDSIYQLVFEQRGMKEGQSFTCDHCGAWFHHGCFFRHEPTGEMVSVGWICADQFACSSKMEKLMKKARKDFIKRYEEKQKAEEIKRKCEEFIAENIELREALKFDHKVVKDIKEQFEKKGHISDAQVALVLKLSKAPKKPRIQEGRRTVTGEIISSKWQDGFHGLAHKMLVLLDTEERIWGTMPADIERYSSDGQYRGLRVEFTATIKRSSADPHFGIYSRPTKARVIEDGHEEI